MLWLWRHLIQQVIIRCLIWLQEGKPSSYGKCSRKVDQTVEVFYHWTYSRCSGKHVLTPGQSAATVAYLTHLHCAPPAFNLHCALTHLHCAPAFNLHCALQHLSLLPAPTSHSSSFSTSELPQKLPDGTVHTNLQHCNLCDNRSEPNQLKLNWM